MTYKGRVLGLTSFHANLIVEFNLIESKKTSTILIDFQDTSCITERPNRTHAYLKINTTRETFEDLVIPNNKVWRDVRRSQTNGEHDYTAPNKTEQRFWTHFCGGARNDEKKMASIIQTDKPTNFTSNTFLNETSDHKCLTMVRQIMVPAMTISSILLGIWVRYVLKDYSQNALI